jgi:hypothetical protein
MGFLLYHKEGTREAMRYTLIRRLPVAGPHGALSVWMRSNAAAGLPFKWELSGERLVGALAPDVDATTHTVVMDMMPERLAGASLCHVKSLAGVTEADESDIVIVMRELSILDLPACGPDVRQSFLCDTGAITSELIESMGVSGGTKRGTYRWRAPKMNIGAAVCGGVAARA